MAWDKNTIFIALVTPITGAYDTASHTVEFQPIDQAYSTGHINGVQCTTNQHLWYPASDLDENTTYDVYCDGTIIGRLPARNQNPGTGG